MEEEIIFKIELNRPQAERDLKAVTGAVMALKDQNKQLETAIKNLQKAEGDHTETIKGATKEIEKNKQKISENAAQQKALVQVINSESNSINALRAQNKLLLAERNTLNTATAEGRARISEINEALDSNNQKIKENVSATEQQKINIGNYASALSGLNPAIGGFISGLQGMIVAAKAFIATPLGLALTGIALLLGPVISFFKDTAVGADIAAKEGEGFDDYKVEERAKLFESMLNADDLFQVGFFLLRQSEKLQKDLQIMVKNTILPLDLQHFQLKEKKWKSDCIFQTTQKKNGQCILQFMVSIQKQLKLRNIQKKCPLVI